MGDITMQDYAKLRKLDDDELNQVSGGGGEQYNENGGGRDIGIGVEHKCYGCGKSFINSIICDERGMWWCDKCYSNIYS